MNIYPILNELTENLSEFLEYILPELSDNWWKEKVLSTLSRNQIQIVNQKEISSLNGLDLAALLTIFDRNWYLIAPKLGFSVDKRNYLKELQTIRNKWAHKSSKTFSKEDIYRDLDTIVRFAKFIKSDKKYIEKVTNQRDELFKKTENNIEKPVGKKDEFHKGAIVVLKSDSSKKGSITDIIYSEKETRYKVFVDGEIKNFYHSQLEQEKEKGYKYKYVNLDRFNSYLTSVQINNPDSSHLFSLNSARIDFLPHQFIPVLKFIKADQPRLLLADEVGVGKTIEAGLIMKEIQARQNIRSSIIICPRSLITEKKWEIEMKKFSEKFRSLNGPELVDCIKETELEGTWPTYYQKVILPYSLFYEEILYGHKTSKRHKNTTGLLELDPPPKFDLVIVDEAHHIRNTDTYSYQAVKYFCDHAEAVLFLTATPIQLGNNDLFVLLNTLRPDLIIDKNTFEKMTEPNICITSAVNAVRSQKKQWRQAAITSLKKVSRTPWGMNTIKNNPDYKNIIKKLKKKSISQEEKVSLIDDIENLHTLSGILNRTRKRDIGDKIIVRKPITVEANLTKQQKDLHDKILEVQAEIYSFIHGDNSNVAFMITTLRRQISSCIFGLVPLIDSILSFSIDEIEMDEIDNTISDINLQLNKNIQEKVEEIKDLAYSLESKDDKLENLKKILKTKQSQKNNKVMLFSSFRHTLNYLYNKLKGEYRVGLIHGDVKNYKRVELKRRFKLDENKPEALDLLLLSEVGCEGLDFQFCNCLINYDIPWNPMRIEQRIGRIDRYGQKSDKVVIYNFIIPGTIDAQIYNRCLRRIGVFENSIGSSEAILGEITKEIKNIAQNFSLSEEERNKRLKKLADNRIKEIQNKRELEEKQKEFFGLELPSKKINADISKASSEYLKPAKIKNLIKEYFKARLREKQRFILGDQNNFTLRLSRQHRDLIAEDFIDHFEENMDNKIYRDWYKWLKGDQQHLSITFSADYAKNHPQIDLINTVHPLTKQASQFFGLQDKIYTSVIVNDSRFKPGNYLFAIYKWYYIGINNDLKIQTVTDNKKISEHLLELINQAENKDNISEINLTEEKLNNLDNYHYDLWNKARNRHKESVKQKVEFKKESLRASHEGRINLIKNQMENSDNEKIIRMKKSQLNNAKNEYKNKINKLDKAIERSDINANPIAYGSITIR